MTPPSFIIILTLLSTCHPLRLYSHLMPWFETKQTNNGRWGIHWTMSTRNPDHLTNNLPDVASHYHPLRGPYASGDPLLVDYQLSTMKAAGIRGVFIDWPGTLNFADYARNRQNAETAIAATARLGLEFAIVYEDHNLALGGAPDRVAQAQADMRYAQANYFGRANYVRVGGAPLVMVFGPQALTEGGQWDRVLDVLGATKPALVTLWYQSGQGGRYCRGEMAWIFSDFMAGLNNWYNNVRKEVKVGVAYPGFNTYYQQGGWPGPTWTIPVGVDTFRRTLSLAVQKTEMVQLATWNDYGEGTMIEPTVEFGYQFLDVVQQLSGTRYVHDDLLEAGRIYDLRRANANNATAMAALQQRLLTLVRKF